MFDELLAIAAEQIPYAPLRALVESILREHRESLLRIPAARHNHHAFVAGWLEHTLSVAQTAVYLAEKYAEAIPTCTRRWTAAWSWPGPSSTTSASSASWSNGRKGPSTRPRAG